jgi:hypothetical protein
VDWAAPVLVDESGSERLPTGEVTVRFARDPSDNELAEFGRRHGLVLHARNEFVPRQAVFLPSERRGTYLPDLCDALASEQDVKEAWPNTLSRYRRA